MANITINNSYTNATVQYSTDGTTWTDIPTSSISVSDYIELRTYTGSSSNPTYVAFTLCFNMDSPSTTDSGASVNVDFYSTYNPYCKLASFSPSNKNFCATIKA